MPVNTPHPQYNEAATAWRLMGVVLNGSQAIKDAGVEFLPQLSNQSDLEYAAYKLRAKFFNGTQRAAEAMTGFIFRKAPVVTAPKNPFLDAFQRDATLTGRSFYDLCKDITDEVIGYGRHGTWIDWDEIEQQAYAVSYCADRILNWKTKRINGKILLSHLVLFEQDPEFIEIGDGDTPGDKYEVKLYDQWREFELLPSPTVPDEYYVQVTVWRRRKNSGNLPTPPKAKGGRLRGTGAPSPGGKGDEDFVRVETFFPERNGAPCSQISFVFHGAKGSQPDVTRPPLEDMAQINVSIYRTSADLENARHMLGVPTPWAKGFSDGNTPLTLGTSNAWVSDNPIADCGFLSLDASGLNELREAIKEGKEEMAQLGARMLEQQGATHAEAYETVALRQGAEMSALMKLSKSLTQSLTDVMAWADWWKSTNARMEDCQKEANVVMNTDFASERLDGPSVLAYVQAFVQGGISFETLFSILQTGEIIAQDVTVEQERARIEKGKNLMLLSAMTQAPPAGAAGAPGRQPPARGARPTPPTKKQPATT